MSESKIDKSYVSSTRGILRIGIILCQLAGLIAVILIVKEKSFEPEFDFVYPVIGFDVLWSIAMIIISSICAWRESQLRPLIGYNTIYNHGSFGAAAAFGLLSAILYAVDAVFQYKN
ncbi:unnamed protein product [Brachionus calyciflorus]|uniref:MARVEL domain-containing protein n=1 Tax=Brachionus calyciflorus TaxID=104777 RepID=A0A814EF66_9BILA|nr:unnamed protein product [Brachionus calyciflorus]